MTSCDDALKLYASEAPCKKHMLLFFMYSQVGLLVMLCFFFSCVFPTI